MSKLHHTGIRPTNLRPRMRLLIIQWAKHDKFPPNRRLSHRPCHNISLKVIAHPNALRTHVSALTSCLIPNQWGGLRNLLRSFVLHQHIRSLTGDICIVDGTSNRTTRLAGYTVRAQPPLELRRCGPYTRNSLKKYRLEVHGYVARMKQVDHRPQNELLRIVQGVNDT